MSDSKVGATDRSTIFFLHIPKAAGMTWRATVERQYAPGQVYWLDGVKPLDSIAELKALVEGERRKFRGVFGHFSFGLHEFFAPPFRYATILRDPVERIVSHYHFAKRNPEHYLHARIQAEGMALEDYATAGLTPELDNGQTRTLAGIDGVFQSIEIGSCSATLLDEAERNLAEHFEVVGTVERFDESLLLIAEALGWSWPFHANRNLSPRRATRAGIPRETITLLEAANSLDMELYERARGRLKARIEERGAGFGIKRRVFISANRLRTWTRRAER